MVNRGLVIEKLPEILNVPLVRVRKPATSVVAPQTVKLFGKLTSRVDPKEVPLLIVMARTSDTPEPEKAALPAPVK